MEKFCEFKIHEYMDMYPEKWVRTFIAEDEEAIKKSAIRYAQDMNRNYSGGTTTFIKVMSKEEAKAHIDSLIAKEKKHWQDDSQEFIDNITKLFNKCYDV